MNNTYNRILNLVTEAGESQGQRMTRMSREQGKKRAQTTALADSDAQFAKEKRKKHGVTDDEISGKVTTHRSGAKLKHVKTGPQGESGFKRIG